MFRKHYKEIIDAVLDFDYSNMSDIGPYFVIEAIVKRVPEVSRDMLDYFWEDLPLTLSKSTQRMIEEEKQKSMRTYMQDYVNNQLKESGLRRK